jgi:hypothetical protein
VNITVAERNRNMHADIIFVCFSFYIRCVENRTVPSWLQVAPQTALSPRKGEATTHALAL